MGMLSLARLAGTLGSSSPASLLNPPRGMAFREYVVSPFLKENSLGGKKIPNSSTLTLEILAVKKCPSSCAKMTTISMIKNETSVISICYLIEDFVILQAVQGSHFYYTILENRRS
jgi:hypothetical protein